MFYAMNLVQTLDLEPVHFGPNMRQMIRKRLVERVRCSRQCPRAPAAADDAAALGTTLSSPQHPSPSPP
jgi:hypothetical protein